MPPEQFPLDRREYRKRDRFGSDQRFSGGGFGEGESHRCRDQPDYPHASPEQLHWDRRDLRKHHRSGSNQRFSGGGFGGGGPHKWREHHNHPDAAAEKLPWDRRDFCKHDRYESDQRFSGGRFDGGESHRDYPHALPEQLHWDRKDFRKHHRSGSDQRFSDGGFGGGGPHRRREQHHQPHSPPPYHHHHNRRQQHCRYSDFRSSRPIPPGHGKEGAWPMYPDEAGHEYPPFGSRYSDRNLEDDNFRPFGSRGDGRYFKSSRENRGSSSQKDWRSPSGEPVASSSGPGRPNTEAKKQKSVENTQTGGYPDETGYGYPTFGSRYGDRNLEDDNFRPFGSRSDGRYFRSSRENRGSFNQMEWRYPSGELVASSRGPGRPNTDVDNPKSVENTETGHKNSSKGNNSENTQTCHSNSSKGNNSEITQTCHSNSSKGNNPPHPLPDSLSALSQSVVKDKHEKDGDAADEPASSGQKSEKENVLGSMDWKLKWNRSGLSSRGSGFSCSSSSKSMGVDPIDIVAEVQQKNATPVNSLAAVCVEPAAPAPSDETSSRKKPRLGWGEGLAKYEKKKFEGPEDGATKDGMISSVSTTETMQLYSVSLLDKSPKVANLSDCASPATLSSVACSSSPGMEEKESIKAVNIDQDTATTYLVANGKRWNREANDASLDILGEASVIAANINDGIETQQKCTERIFLGASTSHKMPRGDNGQLGRSNSLDMYSNETVAADVLAGICGPVSSEAMSSSITSSVEHADGYQDSKCQRVGSCVKQPLTPDATHNADDECSDESCGKMDPTDWSDEEKSIFIQSVSSYGKDFVMISQCLRTRSMEQCKIFYSKARKCLGLDQILHGACNAVSGDVNGGGSDTEDACVVQTGSVVCNGDVDCKMEEDCPPPEIKCSHESDIVGTSNLKPDFKICGENTLDSMAAEPVSKNSSMGDTQVDGKPFVDFNVDSRELSGANSACTSEHDFRTSSVSTNVESVRVEEGDDCGWPNGSSDSDNKALVEVSDGHHGKDNEGEGLILPEDNFYNKKAEHGGANSGEVRCTAIEMKVEPSGNVFHHYVDLFSSMQKESGCQKELPLQQNGHFASVESSMLFSVNEYQRYSSTVALSSVGANGISEKHSQKVGRTGDCQQHLPGYSLSDFVEPSQILRGYPVSMQTVKEINGDVNCVKHVPLQNVPKWDGKLHSDRHTEFSLQKCTTGLRHQSEVVPFPSQESSRDHCTPQSGCSPDVDKPPSRNGYVKLFGKILVPPQERTNSCTQGNGDENGQHHKAGHNSLNLKFSGDQKVNLDSFQSKVDCNNYLASENIPFKNYSCWDENRTQAAIFPPLPDSTLLLAKYPAACSNHSTPTVKLEQTPLNGVIRTNNDHPFNGVSVFPSREMSSTNNGIADYQFLNRELQPFTIYMKQPQEVLFSEMQKRNGFGIVQGMQQQARGMVGIDVVGRGGVLVGDQYSGVSDPVTAIKMHYAKAQNVNLQAGNILREDDKWTNNGDADR